MCKQELLFLSILLFFQTTANPRSPKIYNVLISTKKNLSPSHAVPIYQPYLHTLSGLPFSPLIYQSSIPEILPPTYQPNNAGKLQDIEKPPNQFLQIQGQPNIQQSPIQQFLPSNVYSSPQQISNSYQPINFAPFFQPTTQQQHEQEQEPRQQFADNRKIGNYENSYQRVNDPKTIIANLKRNPNIPDVPPPDLPVRTKF